MATNTERQHHKRIPWWAGLIGSIAISIIAMVLGRMNLFYELELKTYDARFLMRGPRNVDHSDVVIVAVDDEAFVTLPQRWPFPRSYFARMVRNLEASGARMIVFDIQFTEASDSLEDDELAAAVSEAKIPVIQAGKIAYKYHKRLRTATTYPIESIPALKDLPNYNIGIVNEIKDRDGFTRQYPIYIEHDTHNWLPLAVKALQLEKNISDTVFYRYPDRIDFGPVSIPRMAPVGEGTFLINYYGPTETFPTYSIADVLDDTEFDLSKDDTDYMQFFLMEDAQFELMISMLPEEAAVEFRKLREANPFKDKIVFVGASAAELQDLKRTPFYSYSRPGESVRFSETPGVETHANALQTILDQSFIRNVPMTIDFLLIALFTFIVFLISNYTRLVVGSIGTITTIVLLTAVAFYAFIQHQIWLGVIAPILGIILAFITTTIYHYLLEQREKAMIRGMFSQYVPKKVVNELITNPDMLKLGGERRRMTALFTDVAGFTSISEKLSPENLVALLNEYLSEMSRIILENEGIIDKYEGDLIMAEWGAPVYFEDHATWACRAALRMRDRLGEMREGWKEADKPQLYARIGVNTGPMIVGNMGCLEVFDYTVMGDAVNLASRLEGSNKAYGTTIMLGPETYNDVKDNFVTRELDTILVVGKKEPIKVYELLSDSEEKLPEEKVECIRTFEEALYLYYDAKFEEAKALLKKALAFVPDDGPANVLFERCGHFISNPPEDEWKGIWELTSK